MYMFWFNCFFVFFLKIILFFFVTVGMVSNVV